LANPFPGLRPFRSDEHHLFFGREEQTGATCRGTYLAKAHAGGISRGFLHARCCVMPRQSRIGVDRKAAMRANKPDLETWLPVSIRCGSPPLTASIASSRGADDHVSFFYISCRMPLAVRNSAWGAPAPRALPCTPNGLFPLFESWRP